MCDKCDNTGRIPLKNYTHGFYDCGCQSPPQDYYHKADPSDFGYPMSSTFRAASFVYCGAPDPGQTQVSTIPLQLSEQVIVHRHSNMSPLEADILQQTAGKLEHVSKALKEHLNYRKKTNEESY